MVKGKEAITLAKTAVCSYGPREERTFNPKEMLALLDHAELYRQFEDRDLQEQRMSALSDQLKGYEHPEQTTLSDVYEIAKTCQIPQKYIDRALDLTNPSVETQLSALERFDGGFSERAMVQIYGRVLTSSLRKHYPQFEFSSFKYSKRIERIKTEKKLVHGLFTTKEINVSVKEMWAILSTGSLDGYHILVGSPLFLQGAGEALEKLNDFFGRKPRVVVHYSSQDLEDHILE